MLNQSYKTETRYIPNLSIRDMWQSLHLKKRETQYPCREFSSDRQYSYSIAMLPRVIRGNELKKFASVYVTTNHMDEKIPNLAAHFMYSTTAQ
jgi:hypothetical protein